jgi:hypothetical protein
MARWPAGLGDEYTDTRTGVTAELDAATNALKLGGWYDGIYGGIEVDYPVTLREFFDALGITLKDCERAFAEEAPTKEGEP